MKKLVYLIIAIIALGLIFVSCFSVVPPTEKGVADDEVAGNCTIIESGELLDSEGNVITTGYDKWGYNFQAHIFNGWYANQSKPEIPYTKETIHLADSETRLIMKWSDTWLSNKDCDGDGLLDRGYACDPENATSSACEGAWLTNHQWGECEDDNGKTCKWTYFVKMIYPPGGVVDVDPKDGIDDNTGGSIIWGAYVRIQQVSNDPCIGEQGKIFAVQPTGFGVYK